MALLRSRRRRIFGRRSKPPVARRVLLALLAASAVVGVAAVADPLGAASKPVRGPSSGASKQEAQACVIKGNISQSTGERVYHTPDQHYYAATNVDPQRGERWFCTEAEARAAGWRRSRR